MNAPLLSSPSHYWAPDPKIYKSSSGITVQLLLNRLSSSFGISLFLFVWEGGWYFYHVFWLNPTFILCIRCLTKISSETTLAWTILSFHVLFKLHKMSDKHCTSNLRSTKLIWNSWPTLSSDIHTGSSCCFLISSITLGYQLSMEPAGITAEITTSNLKLCSLITRQIFAPLRKAIRYHMNTYPICESPLSGMIFEPAQKLSSI